MATGASDLDTLAVNALRALAMDGVEAAKSGHPGTPMALAPVAYQLWTGTLRYDPADPLWPNRDRYVLSCGHASMLLYGLLHLARVRQPDAAGKAGVELAMPLAELQRFRQWGSAAPGHPEYGHTAGVETTTGPLGQGCGNSVGMAAAAKWLGARYNRPGFTLFDFNVFVQCSDGDLMEGVCCEAASLAGHLQLDNLCWIYDDNQITIEGSTSLAFSEDVATRFRGLGWHVLQVADANDLRALAEALDSFQQHAAGPTLIIVKSVIGYGAPRKAGKSSAHGEPLGAEEVRLAKEALGWPVDPAFHVPEEAFEQFARTLGARGRAAREAWQRVLREYAAAHPEPAAELGELVEGRLPAGWDAAPPEYPADPKGLASRASSGEALNAFAERIPWLVGGSADLAPSTKTLLTAPAAGRFAARSYEGRNFHFGIREHAMASACNGMALCGLRPYAATFFVFSDYLRPAMRLSALMRLPVIYVFTHDSIGVGEDGPTHQPVEQLAAVRAIPGIVVLRPADANETVHAWRIALAERRRPTALVLTRQNLPTFDRGPCGPADGVQRGGYVLRESRLGGPRVLLLATGSEVALAMAAQDGLAELGIAARVVSLPSLELFAEQPEDYRRSVLPPTVRARVAVEAGVRQGWDGLLGDRGAFVGLSTFGASAPAATVFEKMGVTAEAVVAAARRALDAGAD